MSTISPLPSPPTRNNPANFADLADAFLAKLPIFVTETNAVALQVTNDAASTASNTANALTYKNDASGFSSSASGFSSTASGFATTATNAATLAQDWATKTSGYVSGTDYGAKYYSNLAATYASSGGMKFIGILDAPSTVPSNLTNTDADKGKFYKIAGSGTGVMSAYLTDDTCVWNGTAWVRVPSTQGVSLINSGTLPASFTTLAASSTVSGVGFTNWLTTQLASPPTIGGTTRAIGNFSTLNITGNVTFDGGNLRGITGDVGSITIFGGADINRGGGIKIYGSSHATKPNQIAFFNNTTEVFNISASGNTTITGSLGIVGNARRFTANFDDTTLSNRCLFQPVSGGFDGSMKMHLVPINTTTMGGLYIHSTSNLTNYELVSITKAYNGNVVIAVDKAGTGLYRGLNFNVSGNTAMSIDTNSNITVSGGDATFTGPYTSLVTSRAISGLGAFYAKASSNVYNSYMFFGDTTERARIMVDGASNITIASVTDSLYTRLYISAAGAVTIPGTSQFGTTISVGNATPSASGSGITFPTTQSASSDVHTLDDYDEYTAPSAACTGAITTAVVWKLTKVGNLVTLMLPGTLGTASAATSFTYGTIIPAKYRPSAGFQGFVFVEDNGNYQVGPGLVVINPGTGTITVYKEASLSVNFTAAPGAGVYSCSVSWII